MRPLIMAFASLVLSSLAVGQAVLSPDQVVRKLMECNCLDGQSQKVIGQMGDAAAISITKILADKPPSRSDIESILLILNMSFADPTFVEVASDRRPRTALFVLQSLNYTTTAPELKKKIQQTRDYIQQQYAKTASDRSQKR